MTLSSEILSLLSEEEQVLHDVRLSLGQQKQQAQGRLIDESKRARELTAGLVNARRDVDKQLLASDEAVSHQLRNAKKDELQVIERLESRPYFARIVLAENVAGRSHNIEFKLGIAANPDCRIIDWRKAPIAKLYYEYQEGEEYDELILQRERSGIVQLRHRVGIEQAELKRFSSGRGAFLKDAKGDWVVDDGSFGGRTAASYGTLRSIVALITPEQFRMITEDATSAVLIQGVAGSGKTTVAMHRLAWLLHEDNSDLKANEAKVLVTTNALKTYITLTLPSMNIEHVQVETFRDWLANSLRHSLLSNHRFQPSILHSRVRSHPSIIRVKRSVAISKTMEAMIKSPNADASDILANPENFILQCLRNKRLLLSLDSSRLLDEGLLNAALEHTSRCYSEGRLDITDDALLLRTLQLSNPARTKLVRHLVVDEVQELSPIELDCVFSCVADPSQLTLVGDSFQQTSLEHRFLGWKEIQSHQAFQDRQLVFTTLNVSHRSTLPIMRLADYVAQSGRTLEGRKGKPPLWFKCKTENEGVRQALAWLERVLNRFPDSLVAVLCSHAEAARHVYSLLTPSFHNAVRLGTEDSFTFQEGIVVSSIAEVKGLEFPNVILWNPNAHSFPANERSRNLLYVGISRAEENLCIVTWGRPSPLLPSIESKLVRGHQLELDEDE